MRDGRAAGSRSSTINAKEQSTGRGGESRPRERTDVGTLSRNRYPLGRESDRATSGIVVSLTGCRGWEPWESGYVPAPAAALATIDARAGRNAQLMPEPA